MRKLLYTLIVLILLLDLAAIAKADAKLGWAFLAAEHKEFPAARCAEYAKASPAPFLAVLADSFGTNKACLRRFMVASKGKPTAFQYYAGNGAGRRKQLRSYEFLHRLNKDQYNQKLCSGDRGVKNAVIKQARKLKRRCEKVSHPQATCLLSPELESQFTECALNKWVTYAKQAGWKEAQLVHNPVNTGPFQGRGAAGIIERHGLLKLEKGSHIGLDGTCPDHCGPCGITGDRVKDDAIVQWVATHKDREGFFSLWCPEHQGLHVDSGAAPEPRRRNIRVSESSFSVGNRNIGLNIGSPSKPAGKHNLKGCKTTKDFKGGDVAKESDHGGFVAVLVNQLSRARLVAPTGKSWLLRYTGAGNPYQGKDRHHYRHSQSFFKFPDNLVLKGKEKGKNACYKMYKSGTRHE